MLFESVKYRLSESDSKFIVENALAIHGFSSFSIEKKKSQTINKDTSNYNIYTWWYSGIRQISISEIKQQMGFKVLNMSGMIEFLKSQEFKSICSSAKEKDKVNYYPFDESYYEVLKLRSGNLEEEIEMSVASLQRTINRLVKEHIDGKTIISQAFDTYPIQMIVTDLMLKHNPNMLESEFHYKFSIILDICRNSGISIKNQNTKLIGLIYKHLSTFVFVEKSGNERSKSALPILREKMSSTRKIGGELLDPDKDKAFKPDEIHTSSIEVSIIEEIANMYRVSENLFTVGVNNTTLLENCIKEDNKNLPNDIQEVFNKSFGNKGKSLGITVMFDDFFGMERLGVEDKGNSNLLEIEETKRTISMLSNLNPQMVLYEYRSLQEHSLRSLSKTNIVVDVSNECPEGYNITVPSVARPNIGRIGNGMLFIRDFLHPDYKEGEIPSNFNEGIIDYWIIIPESTKCSEFITRVKGIQSLEAIKKYIASNPKFNLANCIITTKEECDNLSKVSSLEDFILGSGRDTLVNYSNLLSDGVIQEVLIMMASTKDIISEMKSTYVKGKDDLGDLKKINPVFNKVDVYNVGINDKFDNKRTQITKFLVDNINGEFRPVSLYDFYCKRIRTKNDAKAIIGSISLEKYKDPNDTNKALSQKTSESICRDIFNYKNSKSIPVIPGAFRWDFDPSSDKIKQMNSSAGDSSDVITYFDPVTPSNQKLIKEFSHLEYNNDLGLFKFYSEYFSKVLLKVYLCSKDYGIPESKNYILVFMSRIIKTVFGTTSNNPFLGEEFTIESMGEGYRSLVEEMKCKEQLYTLNIRKALVQAKSFKESLEICYNIGLELERVCNKIEVERLIFFLYENGKQYPIQEEVDACEDLKTIKENPNTRQELTADTILCDLFTSSVGTLFYYLIHIGHDLDSVLRSKNVYSKSESDDTNDTIVQCNFTIFSYMSHRAPLIYKQKEIIKDFQKIQRDANSEFISRTKSMSSDLTMDKITVLKMLENAIELTECESTMIELEQQIVETSWITDYIVSNTNMLKETMSGISNQNLLYLEEYYRGNFEKAKYLLTALLRLDDSNYAITSKSVDMFKVNKLIESVNSRSYNSILQKPPVEVMNIYKSLPIYKDKVFSREGLAMIGKDYFIFRKDNNAYLLHKEGYTLVLDMETRATLEDVNREFSGDRDKLPYVIPNAIEKVYVNEFDLLLKKDRVLELPGNQDLVINRKADVFDLDNSFIDKIEGNVFVDSKSYLNILYKEKAELEEKIQLMIEDSSQVTALALTENTTELSIIEQSKENLDYIYSEIDRAKETIAEINLNEISRIEDYQPVVEKKIISGEIINVIPKSIF